MTTSRFRVSRDTPSLYITAVAKDRLPVFQTDPIKAITCQGINQARQSCGFLLLAYVLMPDHLHLLTDNPRQASVMLRYIKGTIAHEVIEYLRRQKYEQSLRKLRHDEGKRHHLYSLWGHESNVFSIFSEKVLMQKVNYIHQNPVRAGLVEKAMDYSWSSARVWQRLATENEPLDVGVDSIKWRKSAAGA